MAECEKVCKYIDLPLQHASADVLRRMRRPGNRAAYDKLLARIRRRVPGVTLRTTFIVGFPGETEQDFEELVRVRPRHRVRSRRRLHLLARGRHARLRDGRRRAGRGQGGAARPADAVAEADRAAAAEGAPRRRSSRSWWTARRPTPTSCCRAGSRARRRTSTRWSTCRSATRRAVAPGDLVRRAHHRRRGYDLVAAVAPVRVARRVAPSPSAILFGGLSGKGFGSGPVPTFCVSGPFSESAMKTALRRRI